MAHNGLEDNELHEIMRQRDIMFAECLNNICKEVPEEGSAEDILLKNLFTSGRN